MFSIRVCQRLPGGRNDFAGSSVEIIFTLPEGLRAGNVVPEQTRTQKHFVVELLITGRSSHHL